MKVGDVVRIIHPTGGVRASDRFEIVAVPEDHERGIYTVRGEIDTGFGTRRVMEGGFHHSSLEIVDPVVDPKVTAVHPATLDRARVEANLKARIEQWGEAKIMHRNGALTKEALMRSEALVEQELATYRDACYRELDDGHGLGKEGLDAARELVEDAVWYPLEQLSAGGRRKEAWLVDDTKFRALADAIKVDTP